MVTPEEQHALIFNDSGTISPEAWDALKVATDYKEAPRNACQGHCCEKFYMPVSMEDRQAQIDAKAAGRETWTDRKGNESDLWYFDEVQTQQFIQDMLVPLEKDEGIPNGQWFTCKHFDTQTRSCTVYFQRPGLCRRYPGAVGSGTPCEHAGKGCTFSQ